MWHPQASTPETTTQTTTTWSPERATTQTTVKPVNTDQFDTVIDVAEAGADTSGETPLNSVLDDNLADNTLFKFPSGRYRLDPWEVIGYQNLAIVGEDATLVQPTDTHYWLMFGDLADFRFSGFTIDCRDDGVAPTTYLSVNGGTSVVRDVAVRGHRRATHTAFEVAADDPNADLRFENLTLPDGSTVGNLTRSQMSSGGGSGRSRTENSIFSQQPLTDVCDRSILKTSGLPIRLKVGAIVTLVALSVFSWASNCLSFSNQNDG